MYEDDLFESYEENFKSKNDVECNPDIEDSEHSSDSIFGKAMRPLSDDEFVDPNKYMKNKALHFINVSGKKQLALHQVFKDYKEFNE
ncbi:hypothetical protein PanWU01x14_217380, partial [Parasponia andersonii]